MEIFELTKVDDDCFLIFEHEGLNWMIDDEKNVVYHHETGWEVPKEFKGAKYRTVIKRFKEWWTEREDREEKTKLIKTGVYRNGKE